MTDMIPRLRSVRFKDGRATLRIIRPVDTAVYRDGFARSAKEILDRHPAMSGYVIIAWSKDGATSTDSATSGVPIPQTMLPDFAKTCMIDWMTSNNQ